MSWLLKTLKGSIFTIAGVHQCGKCEVLLSLTLQSPETGFLHSRSCEVRTCFGHILFIEQSKRDVFKQ
jgi:hypothetical protein